MAGRLCDRAAFAYTRASQLAKGDPTRVAMLYALQAHNARYRGQPHGVGRWARRGLALLKGRDDPESLRTGCDLRLFLAQYEQARGRLRTAFDMYEELIVQARAIQA